MVTPKQLQFSTPDGASKDNRTVRNSRRTRTSKRAASDEAGAEEKSKKDMKRRKIKKDKSASSVINRIWSSEDEVIMLKGLSKYKAARGGIECKVEWEPFHPLVGDSITAKFSKEQIMGKARKLKTGFFDHFEKVKQGIDSHSTTFSNAEAFEIAMKMWGKDKSKSGQELIKENEEAVNESEAVENENTKKAQNNESGEEVLKEQNEVANAEPLIDNGADAEQLNDNGVDAEQLSDNGVLKTTQEVTSEKATEVEVAGKESHDADIGAAKQVEKEKQNAEAEFATVQDAFETLIAHDLSEHRKRLQIENLRKLESGTRRKLINEWKAICAREGNLKIRKFKFSAVLAEASKES